MKKQYGTERQGGVRFVARNDSIRDAETTVRAVTAVAIEHTRQHFASGRQMNRSAANEQRIGTPIANPARYHQAAD